MPTSARAECTAFTEAFGEFATSSRADVGIGPYIQAAAAYEFAADFRPLLHPRVGGQSRSPPTQDLEIM